MSIFTNDPKLFFLLRLVITKASDQRRTYLNLISIFFYFIGLQYVSCEVTATRCHEKRINFKQHQRRGISDDTFWSCQRSDGTKKRVHFSYDWYTQNKNEELSLTCGSSGLIPLAVVNTSLSATNRALSIKVKPLWNLILSTSSLYPCDVKLDPVRVFKWNSTRAQLL